MKLSTAAIAEERFHENFLKFFQNAEQKRRWSIDRDISWNQVNPESSDLTADIVQFFSAVELFLPDYIAQLMPMIRRSRGRSWFHLNWGYEESKHSMVLEKWLLESGKRTQDQITEFEQRVQGAVWELPFDHPRQMMIYTMIQELATGVNYTNLRARAQTEGDGALASLLRWVAADESSHYNFFRKGVKVYLELEPDETVADLRYVFENFTMPARALIPDYDALSRRVDAAGVYGPRQYVEKVRLPILADLGVTRSQLKAAGVPSHEADAMADVAEEKAEADASAVFARTFIVPTNPAPLAPSGRRSLMRIS